MACKYTKTLISEKLKIVIEKIKNTLIDYNLEEYRFKYEYNECSYKLICNTKEGKYKLLKCTGSTQNYFLLYEDDENNNLITRCDKGTIYLNDIMSVLLNYIDILVSLKHHVEKIDNLIEHIEEIDGRINDIYTNQFI